MQAGTIFKLFSEKKHGLILTEKGQEAHFNKFCLWGIQFTDLAEGQDVEFEVQSVHNGLLAFNIRRLSKKSLVKDFV